MGSDDTQSLQRPKCPNCDFVGDLGARFCSKCGTRLDASANEAATADLPVAVDEAPSGPLPAVPSEPSQDAVLVVHKGPDEGTRFPLTGDIVRVGRSPDSDVFLDDVTVSRNHAELVHGTGGWLLRDKGSLNGTYLNRSLVNDARLNDGDEVQIGKYRFRFWGPR